MPTSAKKDLLRKYYADFTQELRTKHAKIAQIKNHETLATPGLQRFYYAKYAIFGIYIPLYAKKVIFLSGLYKESQQALPAGSLLTFYYFIVRLSFVF